MKKLVISIRIIWIKSHQALYFHHDHRFVLLYSWNIVKVLTKMLWVVKHNQPKLKRNLYHILLWDRSSGPWWHDLGVTKTGYLLSKNNIIMEAYFSLSNIRDCVTYRLFWFLILDPIRDFHSRKFLTFFISECTVVLDTYTRMCKRKSVECGVTNYTS